MNYDINEEQQLIKDSAHKFLAKECSSMFVREMEHDEKGYNPSLWRKMADLGWMGLLYPEEYGGMEGSFLDMVVLLQEMGFVCLPSPFFTSTLIAGSVILDAGTEVQKESILPEMATGNKILTLALVEPSGDYSPESITLEAKIQDDQYVLSGTKLFVPDAHVADGIICAVRTKYNENDPRDGISLILVDRDSPGLSIDNLSTIAGDKQFEVSFNNVRVPKENLLGEQDKGWTIVENVMLKAAVAKCAEMIGGAARVIELVEVQAKERVQFGSPIGRFQAIQHYCADILTYFDTAKLMTYQAAWLIAQGLPYEKEASMCKAWVSDSYRKLVARAHAILGGMGFMEEHDLQLYFRRAKAAELAYGDSDYHRELVAQKMAL